MSVPWLGIFGGLTGHRFFCFTRSLVETSRLVILSYQLSLFVNQCFIHQLYVFVVPLNNNSVIKTEMYAFVDIQHYSLVSTKYW